LVIGGGYGIDEHLISVGAKTLVNHFGRAAQVRGKFGVGLVNQVSRQEVRVAGVGVETGNAGPLLQVFELRLIEFAGRRAGERVFGGLDDLRQLAAMRRKKLVQRADELGQVDFRPAHRQTVAFGLLVDDFDLAPAPLLPLLLGDRSHGLIEQLLLTKLLDSLQRGHFPLTGNLAIALLLERGGGELTVNVVRGAHGSDLRFEISDFKSFNGA